MLPRNSRLRNSSVLNALASCQPMLAHLALCMVRVTMFRPQPTARSHCYLLIAESKILQSKDFLVVRHVNDLLYLYYILQCNLSIQAFVSMHHLCGDHAPFRRNAYTTEAVNMHHPVRRIHSLCLHRQLPGVWVDRGCKSTARIIAAFPERSILAVPFHKPPPTIRTDSP